MTGIFNARILASIAMLVFVGAAVASSTGAFFNDTETSTGNTFTAGDIDLQIDNESFALDFNIEGFDDPEGNLVFNQATSWALADLEEGTHRFFDFSDVKPGDYGEDTISIHVGSNDAYMCVAARITADDDVTCNEPEGDDDANCAEGEAGEGLGELGDSIQIAFWNDDGDNVFEADETDNIIEDASGLIGNLGESGVLALADTSGDSVLDNPVPGDTTIYIGKAWCMGTMTSAPIAQDGFGSTLIEGVPGTGTNGPDVRGTGFACDGSDVDNAAQTDILQGDLQFYAVQARNNATFTCEADFTPDWPQTPGPSLI